MGHAVHAEPVRRRPASGVVLLPVHLLWSAWINCRIGPDPPGAAAGVTGSADGALDPRLTVPHAVRSNRSSRELEIRVGDELYDVHLRLLQVAGVIPVHR